MPESLIKHSNDYVLEEDCDGQTVGYLKIKGVTKTVKRATLNKNSPMYDGLDEFDCRTASLKRLVEKTYHLTSFTIMLPITFVLGLIKTCIFYTISR